MMKSRLARASAIALAVALVPITTSAISQVESDTQAEIAKFVDILVFIQRAYQESLIAFFKTTTGQIHVFRTNALSDLPDTYPQLR